MIRSHLVLALALCSCMSLRIEADGATTIRSIGAVKVETRLCDAVPLPALAPPPFWRQSQAEWAVAVPATVTATDRTCIRVQGTSLSETAGSLAAGIVGTILGR